VKRPQETDEDTYTGQIEKGMIMWSSTPILSAMGSEGYSEGDIQNKRGEPLKSPSPPSRKRRTKKRTIRTRLRKI